jgi:hypothetical protein
MRKVRRPASVSAIRYQVDPFETSPSRIEDHGRCRFLGLGTESLGERLDELAQRGLRLRGHRGGGAGDEEEGPCLCGRETAQVGSRATDEGPTAASSRLGVHGDPGDRQRLQVAPGRADGHLELLRHLAGRHPASRLEEQKGGDEPICAHGSIMPGKGVRRWPLLWRMVDP